MPNPERIADLQRLAYGAGSTDAERRAALDELEAIGDGRVRDRADATVFERASTSDLHVEGGVEEPGEPAGPDGAGSRDDAGAAEGAAGAAAGSPAPELPLTTAAPGRYRLGFAVAAGILALAIGYAAGSAGAGTPTDASPAEPTAAPAATTPPPVAFVQVAETRAVEVFDRAPGEADLAFDPILFSGFEVDDAGPRLLATRSDGASVWAARTVEGDLCVAIRFDEFSSGAGCTFDGLFPVAEGIGIETYHQGHGYHSVFLDQWGDLRIRIEGVSAAPRT